jgi:hypothetical protein
LWHCGHSAIHAPVSTVIQELMMKSSVFCYQMPWRPLKESRLMFWRNMPPPSSGLKNKSSKKTRGSSCSLFLAGFLAWLTLQSWKLGWYSPPKHQLTFTRLHSIISQMIEFFITITVRISSSTGTSDAYSPSNATFYVSWLVRTTSIIIQFSDKVLCIISTSKGSDYADFVSYNIQILHHYHVFNC